MKILSKFILLTLLFGFTTLTYAGPTMSTAMKITTIRPYVNGSMFVVVGTGSTVAMTTGSNCSSVFKITHNDNGKHEELIATVFLASAQKLPIKIEIPNNTTCSYGTEVQSIYLDF